MKTPTKISICRHTPLCRADLKEECGNFYYGKCDYDDGPCSVNTYHLPDNEWFPIETAPKDKVIMLYRPGAPEWKVMPGYWVSDEYAKKPKPYWKTLGAVGMVIMARSFPPTHWQPMPEPPKEK